MSEVGVTTNDIPTFVKLKSLEVTLRSRRGIRIRFRLKLRSILWRYEQDECSQVVCHQWSGKAFWIICVVPRLHGIFYHFALVLFGFLKPCLAVPLFACNPPKSSRKDTQPVFLKKQINACLGTIQLWTLADTSLAAWLSSVRLSYSACKLSQSEPVLAQVGTARLISKA